MKPVTKRRSLLDIGTKVKLLADYDKRQLSRKEIVKKYGVGNSTFTAIIKDRIKLENAVATQEFLPGRKRIRLSEKEELDKALFAWYKDSNARKTKLSGAVLEAQAHLIAAQIGKKDFMISGNWIHRFKARHGIKLKRDYSTKYSPLKRSDSLKVAKPSASSTSSVFDKYENIDASFNDEVANDRFSSMTEQIPEHNGNDMYDDSQDNKDGITTWTIENGLSRDLYDEEVSRNNNHVDFDDDADEDDVEIPTQLLQSEVESALTLLLQLYQSEDVFIADETGLFYKCLPHKARPQQRHKCSRGQQAKERLTLLVCANMTGTEKLPLLVVGHSTSPCDKNIKSLPVQYKRNKHAWMTGGIFDKWLYRLDDYFEDQGRNILLIVNSCPVHQRSDDLKSVKVVSLSSCTSYLPPCTLGIFNAVKCLYRTQLTRQYLSFVQQNDGGKKYCVSVLDALFILRTAWDHVEQNIIAKAFRMAGFGESNVTSSSSFDCASDLERYGSLMNFELRQLLDRLSQFKHVKCTAPSYVCMDEHIKTSAQAAIFKSLELVSSSDESDSEDVRDGDQSPVTLPQVMTALQTLQQFTLEHDRGDELFTSLGTLSGKIGEFTVVKHSQPKITTFFKTSNM